MIRGIQKRLKVGVEGIHLRYRFLRRLRFRYAKLLTCALFRLWIREIWGVEKLPQEGPAVIVCNHTSYYDWIVLSAIYDRKYIVFVANKDLIRRPIVNWLIRLNILVYIDPNRPGISSFREIIRRLRQGHIVVLYPEGTRSKSGRMIEPRTGFVKLALMTGAPLIPIAIKGAYDILPPHKKVPAFKQCEIFVGDSLMVSPQEPLFRDVFAKEQKQGMRLSDQSMKEIAFRVMDRVADMAGQDWDESVAPEQNDFLCRVRKVSEKHGADDEKDGSL